MIAWLLQVVQHDVAAPWLRRENLLTKRGLIMHVSDWVKPAVWGAIGGAIAAMVIGFSWAGWVTGATAGQMETASAKAAVIQAFVPLCVAEAREQPERIAALKEESTWKHDDFVVEIGWVDSVSDKYRADVARSCAVTLIEGMKSG